MMQVVIVLCMMVGRASCNVASPTHRRCPPNCSLGRPIVSIEETLVVESTSLLSSLGRVSPYQTIFVEQSGEVILIVIAHG